MRKSLNRIFTLTNRNLKEILRDPLSLIFLIAMPLFMQVAFYYLFAHLTTQFSMQYLAPGIVVFSQAFLTLFTGLLISLDRTSAFLTRLYVSKTKPYEFIFGYVFSLLPISFFQTVLFFLVGGIIDPSIFGVEMLHGLLLSLITSIFFIGLGILFGSLCGEKSIGGVSSIIIVGQSVLSGMWFPLEGMGKGIITFMKCLPFRNATLLIQNVLNGVGDSINDFVKPLLIVLAYTIVTLVTSIIVFKNKMKSK